MSDGSQGPVKAPLLSCLSYNCANSSALPAMQLRGGRLCKLTGLTTETNLAEEIASPSRTDESFLLRSPNGDSEDGKNLAQRQAHPLGRCATARNVARGELRLLGV